MIIGGVKNGPALGDINPVPPCFQVNLSMVEQINDNENTTSIHPKVDLYCVVTRCCGAHHKQAAATAQVVDTGEWCQVVSVNHPLQSVLTSPHLLGCCSCPT